MRHAWRIDRAGSLDRLRRVQEPLAAPQAGEVRVGVRSVGLNFADVFACLGLYSATPAGSFVPGLEFAGVVEALGEASPAGRAEPLALAPGDAVYGLTRFGAYATALNVEARQLRRIPRGWSFAEAAAWPAQALTAGYGLVELGRLAPGELALVHSAAGGVGLHALAIAHARGARVVATIGRPEKRELLFERAGLAPEQIVVRDRRRFGAQLDRALGALGADGFDLVFDAVLGPFFAPAWERLRPMGRYVVYGAADFMPHGSRPNWARLGLQWLRRPRVDPLAMTARNLSLLAFNLIWLWERIDRLHATLGELERLLPEPPFVGRRFAFADAPAALRFLQSGASVGKVVLETATA